MFTLPGYLQGKRKLALLGLIVIVVAIAANLGPERGNDGSITYGSEESALSMGYEGGMAAWAPSAPSRGAVKMMVADSDAFMPSPMPPIYETAGETAAEVDQKIIKNGYLRMAVLKVSEAAARISELATRKGGFVQSSSVTERGDGTYAGDVSIRVPAKEFEATMTEIKGFATLVKNENASGQDVTEQFTDLQAQLRNAKAQEETYLEVLKQARSVEDILKVQERLGMIRSQIESLEGRLKYMENVTSYSTISVSLEEEPSVRVPTKEFRVVAIVKEATQALVSVFQQLIAGIIWFVIVWGGVLLPLGLISWIVWKAWKRRANR